MKWLNPIWILFIAWNCGVHGEPLSVLPPHQFTEGEIAEIKVSAPEFAGKRLQWRILLGNAALASGGLSVDAKGAAMMSVEMPSLRSGETMSLSLLFFEAGTLTPLSNVTLWIFPKDLLADVKARFQKSPLQVYDPKGNTVAWLKEAGVPVVKISGLEGVGDGALVIGEGFSFVAHPELWEGLREFAASGTQILCLRPKDGLLDLLDAETGPVPEKWMFASENIFVEWDKRLFAAGLEVQKFNLKTENDGVRFVLKSKSGWSWAAFHYSGGGALYFCGAELVSPEVKSPAAQALLNLLLQKLETHPQTNGENHE